MSRLACTVLLISVVVALGACSSDEDGEGTGDNGDGGEGTGGTGNGNEGGMGTGGTPAPECHSCGVEFECLQGQGGEECDLPVCGEENDVFEELAICVCTECSVECAMACDGAAPEAGCETCLDDVTAAGGACEAAFTACSSG